MKPPGGSPATDNEIPVMFTEVSENISYHYSNFLREMV